MKILLLITLSSLSFRFLNAQDDTLSRIYFAQNESNVWISSNAITSMYNRNYVMAGNLDNSGLLIKTDTNGAIVWTRLFNTYSLIDVLITADSCIVATGGCLSPIMGIGRTDMIVMKLSAEGEMIWSRCLAGIGDLIGNSMIQTADSGFLITGSAYFEAQDHKAFIIKLDDEGNLVWSETLNISEDATSEAYDVKEHEDGSIFICGTDITNNKVFLIRLIHEGEPLSGKNYFPSPDAYIYGSDIEISESELFLNIMASDYISLLKTDLSGNILWSKSYYDFYEGYDNDTPEPKLCKSADNGVLLLSNMGGYDLNYGATAAKFDQAGNLEWAKHLKFYSGDVIEVYRNKFVFTGYGPVVLAFPKSNRRPTISLIKTDAIDYEGDCPEPAALETASLNIESDTCLFDISPIGYETLFDIMTTIPEFQMVQGCGEYIMIGGSVSTSSDITVSFFPNPGTSCFILNISMPVTGEFKIFNSNGRMVYKSELNENSLTIELNDALPGMYFYEITRFGKLYKSGKFIIAEN